MVAYYNPKPYMNGSEARVFGVSDVLQDSDLAFGIAHSKPRPKPLRRILGSPLVPGSRLSYRLFAGRSLFDARS